ncbi:MAG: hypothetical protein WA964_08520 [Ilumatobacter sp.]|uniref:hypothetical protein n=1 Tax=Ilumatobacter sp. TaxID=1967498 RepID=UPI003C76D0FB
MNPDALLDGRRTEGSGRVATTPAVLHRLGHRSLPHVVYLVAAIGSWPWLASSRPGPDAVSYFSIAQSWADGRWSDALNAFWSPLLSWLLIPAALFDLPLVQASQVLSILIGSFTVWRLRIVLDRLDVSTPISGILTISAVPFLLHAVYGGFTPDLLMASLLLGYIGVLVDPDTARRGVRAGGWAAVAFFAKAYALPFAIAHLICWLIVMLWRRTPAVDVARSAAMSLSIIGVTVLAWTVPLSIAYGAPTLSTTAAYHVSVASPGSPGSGVSWAGLLEPPNEFAVSAWEEPSLAPYERNAAAAPEVDPGSDETDGRATRLVRNTRDAAASGASLIGIVVLAALASIVIVATARRRSNREVVVHTVTAAVVYTSGLLLLFIDRRYMFFVLLLAVVVAAWFIARLVEPNRGQRTALAFAVVVGLVSMPLSLVALSRVAERATTQTAADAEFDAVLSSGDRVASSNEDIHAFSAACYRIGCTYLGSPTADSGADLAAELCAGDVDIFVTDESNVLLPAPARELTSVPRVYERVWDVRCPAP